MAVAIGIAGFTTRANGQMSGDGRFIRLGSRSSQVQFARCAGIMQKNQFAHRHGDKPHTALEFAVAMLTPAIIQCEIGVEMWAEKEH